MMNLLLAWRLDFVIFAAVTVTAFVVLFLSQKKTDRQRSWSKIALSFLALTALTGVMMEFSGNVERSRICGSMSEYAPTYARVMISEGIEKISPQTPADDPLYLRLIALQKQWLELNPAINDVYTFIQEPNGSVLLLVDSETDYDRNGVYEGEREQRTAIGDPYEATPALLGAFEGKSVFDGVPYTDRWGTWVSAYYPMRGNDGRVIGVLGVDYEASRWVSSILWKRFSVMITALAILVLLMFSFSLKRYSSVVLILIFGVFLSCLAGWSVHLNHNRTKELAFRQAASERISGFTATLKEQLRTLTSIESFYASSTSVDRDEFKIFTQTFLENDKEIKNLQWIPYIRDAERETMEAAVVAEGLESFEFKELDAQGRPVRAGIRSDYYPVFYVEPIQKSRVILGYDHGSDVNRRAAVLKARDTGREVVTPGILSDAGQKIASSTVLILKPISKNAEFTGVVAGVYDIADVFQTSIQGFEPENLKFVLKDVTSGSNWVILSDQDTEDDSTGEREDVLVSEEWKLSRQFEFCDRIWELSVVPVRPQDEWNDLFAWLTLAAGLILTILLSAYLLMLTRHASRQEELAEASRRAAEALRLSEERTRGALEESKKAHSDLKQTQMQLIQADRLSAIGQLAAGVAHEINNPIGFVNSNLSTLGKYGASLALYQESIQKLLTIIHEGKNPDEILTLANEIAALGERLKVAYIYTDIGPLIQESQSGLDRVKKIVMDLKTFVRADNKESMDLADLNEILNGTVNVVWNELKYKVNLVKELGEIPQVHCHRQQMGQVFINMLMNAAQAIKETGTITVRSYVKDTFVCVDIEDTGEGIPDNVIDHIFDPFFTTKEVGQGTGLGLGISYDIIKKHGGRIEVSTKVGQGTKFTVLLPLISCRLSSK